MAFKGTDGIGFPQLFHSHIQTEDKVKEGDDYFNHGLLYQGQGDYQKSIKYYIKSLGIAKELGNRYREGIIHENLGHVFYKLGNFDQAVKNHARHLDISREINDRAGEGRGYGNLGNDLLKLCRFREALKNHKLALNVAQEEGDTEEVRNAYGNIGCAYTRLCDFNKAIEYHTKHLNMATQVNDRLGERRAYANLAQNHLQLGQLELSQDQHKSTQISIIAKAQKEGGNRGSDCLEEDHFKQATHFFKEHINLCQKLGDREGEARSQRSLDSLYFSQQIFENAMKCPKKILEIAKKMSNSTLEENSDLVLGLCYYKEGNFQKAIHHITKHIEAKPNSKDLAPAYEGLGLCYSRLNNFNRAAECHKKAFSLVEEAGDKILKGAVCLNLGNAYHDMGSFQEALKFHLKSLEIAKEQGEKTEECCAYRHAGNDFYQLGDFKEAVKYHNKSLSLAKELGNRAEEGKALGGLGNAYVGLGGYKKAIEVQNRCLNVAKEINDRTLEGATCGNLGIAYDGIGDFKASKQYHKEHLAISKETGHRIGEKNALVNLGNVLYEQHCFRESIEYYEQALRIAREMGRKDAEGTAYGSIGNAYVGMGEYRRAIEYLEKHVAIAQKTGNKAGEGRTYSNLGNAHRHLGNHQKAAEYHQKYLKIAQELGDRAGEAVSYYSLGLDHESNGSFPEAKNYYQLSTKRFNDLRALLTAEDAWKINFRERYRDAYSALWRTLVKNGEIEKALCAAEQGRAQALLDSLKEHYGASPRTSMVDFKETVSSIVQELPKETVFIAVQGNVVFAWMLNKRMDVQFRTTEIKCGSASQLIQNLHKEIGAEVDIRCENRSMDERSTTPILKSTADGRQTQKSDICLQRLFEIIIEPIAQFIQGEELIVVPDGPFCLVPYSALSESIRIHTVPSLSTLQLIIQSPEDFHHKTGALLVGDPAMDEVPLNLLQLPFARKEVEMIARRLKTLPLTGKNATKKEVLERITSVALIHFAAHGRCETGEIALAPNLERSSQTPKEEDFILTISDVQAVQLKAKLVVLSCCHSGRGEVKSEGVVGMARSFLFAGARSVLVSLWAIDDEATLLFMDCFYQHLVDGKCASVALHQAMKSLRESENYGYEKYWAPFVLIGDDVTMEFGETPW
ncbi:tetratricopeptide repeat protein 28-like [Acropora muricata]|uniref:tetratricopeptide repeat protein 28-like n=1 Tax=Acropora muricata TaxID=159855 RepID=UPI0034E4D6FC